ncbi:BTB/POZ domain-containing protein At5g66560-like [Andrographis paniculata]|uniref:BTB/POZ domain-containing protein At5g66560-like n=1 Tax=Andrographis paniculata TaxID=175694 RepID=UPI0021E94ABD|nr:BTB/POZ domain-containing protein At5g66560-like [Andrographis paniculata]
MVDGKLIDDYLVKIAYGSNLKLKILYDLGVVLLEDASLFDDRVYRAVDFYLKGRKNGKCRGGEERVENFSGGGTSQRR